MQLQLLLHPIDRDWTCLTCTVHTAAPKLDSRLPRATSLANPPPCPAATQGVYVLQDNGFRWLQRLAPPTAASGAAADPAREEALRRLALSYLHVPCGIVRGALCHLGVVCTVEPDPKALPSCEWRALRWGGVGLSGARCGAVWRDVEWLVSLGRVVLKIGSTALCA